MAKKKNPTYQEIVEFNKKNNLVYVKPEKSNTSQSAKPFAENRPTKASNKVSAGAGGNTSSASSPSKKAPNRILGRDAANMTKAQQSKLRASGVPAKGIADKRYDIPGKTPAAASKPASPSAAKKTDTRSGQNISGLTKAEQSRIRKDTKPEDIRNTIPDRRTYTQPEEFQGRKGNLYDNTVGSFQRGIVQSDYGQELHKQMLGQDNKVAQYEKQLSGDTFDFQPEGAIAKAVSQTAEFLGQQVNQLSDWKSVGTALTAGGAAFMLGQVGPQIAAPEELITVPLAFGTGLKTGASGVNFEVESGFAYKEMIENGISAETAKNIALGVGGANAALEYLQLDELAKGYKVLAKSPARGTEFTRKLGEILKQYGMSTATETAQELMQESVTMGGANLANEIEGKPLYSNEEILDRLKDTAGSALAFGVMGGPGAAMQVNHLRKGVSEMGRNINNMGITKDIIESGLESGEKTSSYKKAQKAKEMLSQGRALSDFGLGNLHLANIEAVNAENDIAQRENIATYLTFSGVNSNAAQPIAAVLQKAFVGDPLSNNDAETIINNQTAREMFESATGIVISNGTMSQMRKDVKQFAVDILNGRRQPIYYEMNDAAPAKKTPQNPHEMLMEHIMAHPEDIVRSEAEILDQENSIMSAAEQFYRNMGETQIPFDKISEQAFEAVDPDLKVRAYFDGVAMSNQRMEAKRLKGDENGGLVNRNVKGIPKKTIQAIDNLGKAAGVKIEIVDAIFTKSGAEANGSYEDGVIKISRNADKPLIEVLRHEITHALKKTAPAEYEKYKNFVINAMIEKEGTDFNTIVAKYDSLYSENGEELEYDEVVEEIVSDFTKVILKDQKFIKKMAGEETSTFKKLLKMLSDFIKKLSANRAIVNEYGFDLKELKQAEKMWLEALESVEKEDKSVDNSSLKEGKPKMMFMGQKAKGANLKMLEQAKQMELEDKSADEIWKETGWTKGPDKKWRWEIDDSKAEFSLDGKFSPVYKERDALIAESERYMRQEAEIQKKLDMIYEKKKDLKKYKGYNELEIDGMLFKNDKDYRELKKSLLDINDKRLTIDRKLDSKLEHYYDHPELYDNYPGLKTLAMRMEDDIQGYSGSYNEKSREIMLNKSAGNKDKVRGIALHEIQHAIQSTENFAKGAEVKGFDAQELQDYNNSAGEIEARQTQERRNMTAKERREKLPNLGGDEAIVKFSRKKKFDFDNYKEAFVEQMRPNHSTARYKDRKYTFDGKEFVTVDELEEYANSIGFVPYDPNWRKNIKGYYQTEFVDELQTKEQELRKIKTEAIFADFEKYLEDVGKKSYIRFGKIPESGKSYNFRDKRREEGVSVFEAYKMGKNYVVLPKAGIFTFFGYLEHKEAYLVEGEEIGIGSDDEPVLSNAKILKKVNKSYIYDISSFIEKMAAEQKKEKAKFSKKRDLMAIHNTTQENFIKSLRLGGIPVPSIAVAKADMGHSEFGEISVLFHPDTIDGKKSKANKVFTGDAWTQTFPNISPKVNERVYSSLEKKIESLLPDLRDYRDVGYLDFRYDEVQDKIERHGSFADAYFSSDIMRLAFLRDTGREFKPAMKERTFLHDRKVMDSMLKIIGSDKINEWMDKDEILVYEPQIRDAINKYYESLSPGMTRYEKPMTSMQMDNTIGALREYDYHLKQGAPKVIDSVKTREKIDKAVNKNVYRKWLEDISEGIIEKYGIRNNKDLYTNNGRRSWDQLYVAPTLENITRSMISKDVVGNAYGDTKFISGVKKELTSVADIRNHKEILKSVTDEEIAEIKKSITARLLDMVNRIRVHKQGREDMFYTDYVIDEIVEHVIEGKTRANIERRLKTTKYGNIDTSKITDEVMDDLMQLIEDAQTIPTRYFEAKPQRAVGLDEIKRVVLPRKGTKELRAMLDNLNIPYVTYDGTEEDRLNKINAVDEVKFSRKSMRHDLDETTMMQDLVQHGVFTEDEANVFRQNIEEILGTISANASILDMNETTGRDNRRFLPYKQNSDKLYKVSVDYSTLCRKRILSQLIVEALQVELGKALPAAEQLAINRKLQTYKSELGKIEVACAVCYVESARLKSPEQINRFIENKAQYMTDYFAKKNRDYARYVNEMAQNKKVRLGYGPKATKKEMKAADYKVVVALKQGLNRDYQPSEAERKIIEQAEALPAERFLTNENLNWLMDNHREIYNAFINRIREATKSKGLETDIAGYYGDSLLGEGKVTDSLIELMNKENGLRTQSWSDFQVIHLLDMMTAIIEMSIRGAKMHGYSKVPDFVRLMGHTGLMINMSLIPLGKTGFDEEGNLAFSPSQGMPVEDMRELRSMFPQTAGNIALGIKDAQIKTMMKNEEIDYIIPYHMSGLKKAFRNIVGIGGWDNYESLQNESKIPGFNGKTGEAPVFSEWFTPEEGKTGIEIMRSSAEKYKKLCFERGLIPKFPQFQNEEDYWKVLVDRKMINQETGEIIIQQKVRPVFDFKAIDEMLQREVDSYNPQLRDKVVKEVIDAYHSGEIAKIAKKPEILKLIDELKEMPSRAVVLGANPSERPKHSFKGQSDIVRRNRILQEQNEKLKNQMKLTKKPQISEAKSRKYVNEMLRAYGSKHKAAVEEIQALYTDMMADDVIYEDMRARAQEIASRILEDSYFLNKEDAETYKGLISYMKMSGVSISKEYVADIMGGLSEFKKKNRGLRIADDATPVDTVYMILLEEYPELFNEDITHPADQLLEIAEVLKKLQPSMENPYSPYMEEATQFLANEILDNFFDIPQQRPTFADKKEAQLTKERIRSSEKIASLKEENREKIYTLIKLERDKRNNSFSSLLTDIKRIETGDEEIDNLDWILKQNFENMDFTKEEKQTLRKLKNLLEKDHKKTLNAAKKDAVQRAKERQDYIEWWKKNLTKLEHREALKEKVAHEREKTKKRARLKRIKENVKQLQTMLLSPTDQRHIPEVLRKPVAEFLDSLDFTNSRQKEGTRNRIESLHLAYLKIMVDDINGVSQEYFDIAPDTIELMAELSKTVADKKVVDMNASEIEILYKIVISMKHLVSNYNKLLATAHKENVSDYAMGVIADAALKKTKKERVNTLARSIDGMLNYDMLAPLDYFTELGHTMQLLYKNLRRGLDKKLENTRTIEAYMHNLLDGVDIKTWTGDGAELHHFNFESGDSIDLTTAQIMSLYLLSQREQALLHIYVGGISQGETVVKDKYGRVTVKSTSPAKITPEELVEITSKLTEEQRKVAKGIQAFLQDQTSEWGNEVSMKLFGYKKFGEENYFPIKSNDNYLSTQYGMQYEANLRNAGFTKSTIKGANNPIMIEDVFDVFTTTADKMGSYNAFVLPLSDLQKVMNYKDEDGSVKQAIERAFGKKGLEYFKKLMVDVNGGVRTEAGTELLRKLLANYKAAAMGLNLRVIIQQPTAIVRASAMIDPKYLIQGILKKSDYNTVLENSPIAKWKSYGYFNLDIGRQLKDVFIGKKYLSDSFFAAISKADDLAWGKLWNAVELETQDKYSQYEIGSPQYWQAVSLRFSDIVDKTQVVDTVLHRTQIMRSHDNLAKIYTSFMAEPMKSFNLLRTSILKAREYPTAENKKQAARSVAAWAAAVAVNSAVVSLIDMYRKADDDEEWIDQYLRFLAANASNDLSGMIPVFKDIASLMNGYAPKRMELEGFNDAAAAVKKLSGYMTAMANGEAPQHSIAYIMKDASSAAGKLLGIPVANVIRELEAIGKNTLNWADKNEMNYAVTKMFFNIANSDNKKKYYDILYKSMMDGNEEETTRIYNDMLVNGFKASEVENAMNSRTRRVLEGSADIAEMGDKLSRYKNMTAEEKKNFQQEFRAAAAKLKERGFTPEQIKAAVKKSAKGSIKSDAPTVRQLYKVYKEAQKDESRKKEFMQMYNKMLDSGYKEDDIKAGFKALKGSE